ncbi:type VI secretion system baseplate subunit TssK [Methylomonas sp. UP202]|uniref:type VI secretion system baseplate subunit TssK n=1 Tax=Methylomonas sp. UP202 TaxID=3040943 RepID=UPI00247AA43D|nr:type VI secretion system baseplate subunit TssK [Methylomonas sp. UP202]WGS86506.1 type VI secretion system baseplate subunit TssK [Methylomonas sp. UP202]
MSNNNRIVWSEGMFLRPQHFQQHDRYLEARIDGRCHGIRAFDWGYSALEIDHGSLAIGKICLLRARGIFQDGTPYNLPTEDELPLPLDIPSGTTDERVYLALPMRRSEAAETDDEHTPDSLARYRIATRDVRDSNAGNDGRYPVQIGVIRPRLMLESEERSGFLCLGVARIIEVRADKTVLLDDNYIPPVLKAGACGLLSGFLRELNGLLHTRGEALASRVSGASQGAGVAEVADFMLLQTINRYQPLLQHLANETSLHPESMFSLSLQIMGDLSTFYRQNKRPAKMPDYQHDDLRLSFIPLIEELRRLLSMVLEQNAIQIPLNKHSQSVYYSGRPDVKLLDNAIYVLAAGAQISSEMLRTHFPPQVKIGPVEEITQLVTAALPGISIHPLPVAPRQLPYHAGYSYFELDKHSPYWKKMADSGGFAFHIGGNFPGLELEFWAIKKG